MKTIKLIFIQIIISLFIANSYGQQMPFPQHNNYQGTHIKPNNYSQAELDQQVITFYEQWKSKYLINGCESNHYYVFFDSGNTVTVSEAMGYGMMIIPLMAGYDENARTYFNGLYRYYKAHPSVINPNLMAWKQITNCINSDGPDSASDGDIDIAFGLLLAHAQWGSWGSINYYQEAEKIINAIMESDINHDFMSVKLGDWVNSGNYTRGTRTSDFIFDHFRIFQCAVNDEQWQEVVDQSFNYMQEMQENYSPVTGLMPDFIVDINTTPRPADPNFLEGENDGNYSYNACRDPWRVGTDFLISNEEKAKNICLKINRWLLEKTEGNTSQIMSGYTLAGDVTAHWQDLSFIAPFTVGAMCDTENQEWLNNLYDKTLSVSLNMDGYYGNTIKLLSMITLSGNYWVPSCENMNGLNDYRAPMQIIFQLQSNIIQNDISITTEKSTPLQIRILDIHGRLLRQQELHSTQGLINIQKLKAGTYFIEARQIGSTSIKQTERFIKL